MNLNFALSGLGMAMIVAALGYWLATGTQSLLFVGAGMILICIGSNEQFRHTVPHLTATEGEYQRP